MGTASEHARSLVAALTSALPHAEVIDDCAAKRVEAERELSTKKGDQIVAFENYWHRMKGVEKLVQLKSEAGSGATQDVAETRFYRLQAEVWMERAKAP